MHGTCARLQSLRTLLATQPWFCFGLKPPRGSHPRNTCIFHTEEKCSAASKWAWKWFKLHQWNPCCRHSLWAKFGLCGKTPSGSETPNSLGDGRAQALAAVTVYWMCSLLLLWTAGAKFWCSQCNSFMQSGLFNVFLRPGTLDIVNVPLSSLYSVYCCPGILATLPGLSTVPGYLLEALEDEDTPASKSLSSCLCEMDYSPRKVREWCFHYPLLWLDNLMVLRSKTKQDRRCWKTKIN